MGGEQEPRAGRDSMVFDATGRLHGRSDLRLSFGGKKSILLRDYGIIKSLDFMPLLIFWSWEPVKSFK